ncbi:MAG TPA: hypothetical protein VHF06_11785, partial [Pseudonocardiaceae bacterium]|nr:hypothetical protein [Pseudonocardiaceae bacterium]
MSFTDFRGTDVQTPTAVDFVGIKQYLNLFANPEFRHAFLNTGYFVIVGMPLTMEVALALAVALNNGITRFRSTSPARQRSRRHHVQRRATSLPGRVPVGSRDGGTPDRGQQRQQRLLAT